MIVTFAFWVLPFLYYFRSFFILHIFLFFLFWSYKPLVGFSVFSFWNPDSGSQSQNCMLCKAFVYLFYFLQYAFNHCHWSVEGHWTTWVLIWIKTTIFIIYGILNNFVHIKPTKLECLLLISLTSGCGRWIYTQISVQIILLLVLLS